MKAILFCTDYRSVDDPEDTAAYDKKIEDALVEETSLIILDTLELLFVQNHEATQSVFEHALRILLHLMSCNQSHKVFKCTFASQRAVVNKFPELFYEDDDGLCAELCVALLRHCNSALPDIRAWACASLYQLMRLNYQIKKVRNNMQPYSNTALLQKVA